MTNTLQNELNNITVPHESNEMRGSITYENRVVEKIVGKALETVPGLLSVSGGFFSNLKNKTVNSNNVTDGVNVEVGQKEVAVDLDIVVEYGKDIPDIVDQMKSVISNAVADMTHLEVVEVNVNVVDTKTRAEHEAESVTVQDKLTGAAKATGEFTSKQASNIKTAVDNGAEALSTEPRVN
ncbi:Asp23/Gls24 family envelope stress response protein [Streptococcus moroccensis]|uniref:Stress response regulator gls24 homolog n=1 Tax=Streptococcus moroccensis TaxID=1451356 RepID=A0ABT9YR07_9STRE|nr:Asp23/Gls24 family envelope stress response protein [Streptococcus moroccensis]MDQ0221733.1 putative alkaline shock family protein YloU [Streptococcus moroccensis]